MDIHGGVARRWLDSDLRCTVRISRASLARMDEISASSVSFGAAGPWSPETTEIPTKEVVEIFLGHHGHAGDREGCLTINVFHSTPPDRYLLREILGIWLAPDIKIGIFDAITRFVAMNDIAVKLRSELSASQRGVDARARKKEE